MGTTKLTRKEILAEDPVHGSIITLVDFFRSNRKMLSIVLSVAIVLALGVYGGFLFLEKKQAQAQEILGRGMDFFHAQVETDAPEDPFENGPVAVFDTDEKKYQAAAKEFEIIVKDYGYTKVAPIARYYLGLSELKMDKTNDAVENLKMVSGDNEKSTIGCLAGQVLARIYEKQGNYEEARKILEPMIDNDSYELPKEELRMQLAGILADEGRDDEALNILQEGVSEVSSVSPLRDRLTAEMEKMQKKIKLESNP
ncbi:MAG: tetratricopeptide repeat protein [Acidobacteriota bacterium]